MARVTIASLQARIVELEAENAQLRARRGGKTVKVWTPKEVLCSRQTCPNTVLVEERPKGAIYCPMHRG